MKLSEVIPFLTFSAIADHSKVEEQFKNCHSHHLSRFPYWSISATRRKLMSAFWYTTVFRHFIALFCIALIVSAFFDHNSRFNATIFLLSLCMFCIAFFVMLLFIYLPAFQSTYLPLLDSYLETYSGRHLEGIQKCKKEQYPVMTLMLIQYCFHKLTGIEGSLLMDPLPRLLMRQYGVSQKMIDTTLRTIILNNWDSSKIRKRTEITEAFEEAATYFQSFGSEKAVQLLNNLQLKILNQAT